MNHDPVHRNGGDIARLYLFACIMMNDLFNHCLAHNFSPSRSVQTIQLPHGFHQSAGSQDIHEILRQGSDGVLFSLMIHMLIHDNGDFVALLHMLVKLRLFDEQKAVVDGIAEKDPREGFGDDTLDSQRFDDLRRLLSGGTAAEVLTGNDDIAFPDLSG